MSSSSASRASTYSVKSEYQGELRRVSLPLPPHFGTLLATLRAAHPALATPASPAVKLQYRDDDNELVTVTSSSELVEAIRLAGNSALRVSLTACGDVRDRVTPTVAPSAPAIVIVPPAALDDLATPLSPSRRPIVTEPSDDDDDEDDEDEEDEEEEEDDDFEVVSPVASHQPTPPLPAVAVKHPASISFVFTLAAAAVHPASLVFPTSAAVMHPASITIVYTPSLGMRHPASIVVVQTPVVAVKHPASLCLATPVAAVAHPSITAVPARVLAMRHPASIALHSAPVVALTHPASLPVAPTLVAALMHPASLATVPAALAPLVASATHPGAISPLAQPRPASAATASASSSSSSSHSSAPVDLFDLLLSALSAQDQAGAAAGARAAPAAAAKPAPSAAAATATSTSTATQTSGDDLRAILSATLGPVFAGLTRPPHRSARPAAAATATASGSPFPFGLGLGRPSHANKRCGPSAPSTSSASTSTAVDAATDTGEHDGIRCDGCGASPIRGVRYQCTVCDDYDLCAVCERSPPSSHSASHPLLKLRPPTSTRGGEVVHDGIECDGCGALPIVGVRYQCSECVDYDLCSSCESKNVSTQRHSASHALVKHREAARSRRGQVERHPLLGLLHGLGLVGVGGAGCRRPDAAAASKKPSPPQPQEYQCEFISDSTLPDGSVVVSGSAVKKSWRVRNTGTTAWPASTRLRLRTSDHSTATEWSVPLAGAGEEVEVSVPLRVPSLHLTGTSSGRLSAHFQLVCDGRPFGPHLWADLKVMSLPVAVPAAAPSLSSTPPSATDSERKVPLVAPAPAPAPVPAPAPAPAAAVAVKPALSGAEEVLASMGFANRELNQYLLGRFAGDTQKVVEFLLSKSA